MNPDLCLPYFVSGRIVKGFGRGSRDLGFPTANFSEEITDSLPDLFTCGIYYGWAKVDDGPVHKMVMSIGYNPFYNNSKKTMETHILHKFDKDLYGSYLKLCILGYLRTEKSFDHVEELVNEIKSDIRMASELLDDHDLIIYKNHGFFNDQS